MQLVDLRPGFFYELADACIGSVIDQVQIFFILVCEALLFFTGDARVRVVPSR